jgi:dTDP-4-dehydrorhamnose reductase
VKIFVTGAYGQLGRELCWQIGSQAVPSDCDTLDLRNGSQIRETLFAVRPDLVLHCAAYTQVDLAEKEVELCRAINAQAVAHIAEACRELDCPLLQVSTDYVFTGNPPRGTPYKESDRPMPQGVYAVTKWEGEQAAAAWEKHWIVRTCGLYARPSHAEAKNFVRTMLRLGSTRPELKVVDDQVCTPSYVPHVARAILFLAGASGKRQAPWGLYHVVNAGQATWRDFAVEIFRLARLDVAVQSITTAQYAAPSPRPAYSVLDTSVYHSLGGPPLPDWKAALAEYFAEMASLEMRS